MSESPLVAKTRELVARFETQRAESHRAQLAEALARVRLGEALAAAQAARALAEAQSAEAGWFRHHVMVRAALRPGRRNRLRRLVERVLARLGAPGQAVVVRAAGIAGPLFDAPGYLARYPDVAQSGLPPMVHYVLRGGDEGRDPHPLLDGAEYRRRNAQALAATGLTPLEHFLRMGAVLGSNPHPLFDLRLYAAQTPELSETGENPLLHYLRTGGRGRPHPLFDPDYYRAQAGLAEAEANPLLHYLAAGSARGLRPHPLFDPAWVRARYDLPPQTEPLTWFVALGGLQDLDPSPWFDAARYKVLRGPARPADLDPLTDYLSGGAWALPEAVPGFQTAAYLAAHPELAATGLTPLEHWARQTPKPAS